jgi:ribosomal protein L37AE/L43A
MSDLSNCTTQCEARPKCTVCGKTKYTRGRDPGLLASSGYCAYECPGHDQEPRAGHLLPGELERSRMHACPKCNSNDDVNVGHVSGYSVCCDRCYDFYTDGEKPLVASAPNRADAIALWNEMAAKAMAEAAC